MEAEDKIVAGLQQLHNDLEKVCALVEASSAQASARTEQYYGKVLSLNKRSYRRNLVLIVVFMIVLAGIIGFRVWSAPP